MVLVGRRQWRLFYCFACLALAAVPSLPQTPALTTVSDTVFRADGNPASGTLLISWPAFTTADNHGVAAGATSVTLAANGTFSVQLAPNSGGTPSVVYTVVYQLTDGTVKTESWSVGTTSPETIAQVRTLVGLSFGAAQFATQSYVNAALANVVHLSGTETITGPKQFSVSPILPAPSQSGQAVNKAYVDASVTNSGSGNFVMKSGDAMTGSLTLPSDPTAPNQAATKHYVDVTGALKADLLGGTVPVSELGTGTANNSACLHGDSTWSGCGTGNGSGLTAGMQAIKYATDFAWNQSNGADLSTAGAKTVTLAACPLGVSGAEPQYYVYVSGTGTAEAVLVTGGTCAANNQPGTLQFTTANAHPAGFAIGSASGGLQEALIAARFAPSNPAGSSQSGRVIVPPGEMKAFARVSIRASNITVDFSGSIVECWMNDTCIFVGDGLTSRFFLSQTPFTKFNTIVLAEEYTTATLDSTRWSLADPAGAVNISAGKLQIAGGNGVDGATTVNFVEKVELGGAWILQHGDVVFNAASSGILGGLYLGPVLQTNCIAGFQLTPAGAASQIQALIDGVITGAAVSTVAGHHYVLTTRIYSQEIYRQQQVFHGASYPDGSPAGGATVSANVRLVLEVHDVDPTNPATQVAASTVLYDSVISNAPALCTYSLVNSVGLQCSIAFTRMIQAQHTEVRSAPPSQSYRTRLVGPLTSGGECNIYSGPTLDFFSEHVPVLNELIEVHYRGHGRAMARVTNAASIAAEQRGTIDGVRAAVRHLKAPPARTSVDCENAALVIVTDGATSGCTGKYQTWSDFLPGGAADIFPGDALAVNIASRAAVVQVIVKEVTIAMNDLVGEHCVYEIQFEDAASTDLAFDFDSQIIASFESNSVLTTAFLGLPAIPTTDIGSTTLPSLISAAITDVSSTTVSLDAGLAPQSGGGIEVRWSDFGWGPDNDQNLAGRFTTQTFTLPRLAKAQDYFLRQYDGSTPPKYSRFTSALHVSYPF